MHRSRRLTVASTLGALALSVFAASSSTADPIIIIIESPNAWFGANEGPLGSIGKVTFTPSPLPAPLGNGSATLEVDDTGRASFGTALFKGTPLSSITQLTFSSYASSTKSLTALALQFDVDYDRLDADSSYQGRLSFEPASAPTPDTWDNEDALAGTWWATRSPGNTVCPQSAPCTWAQVLTAFPNAAIRNDPIGSGALLFRLGGPITGGALASVDNFTIGISGTPTTFDFEPGASVNPSIGPAGSLITAQAYGFKPNARVHMFYYTNVTPTKRVKIRPDGVHPCSTRASWTGSFYCMIALPTEPVGLAGVHNIRIKGQRRIDYFTTFVLTP